MSIERNRAVPGRPCRLHARAARNLARRERRARMKEEGLPLWRRNGFPSAKAWREYMRRYMRKWRARKRAERAKGSETASAALDEIATA